jgi:NAD(P)-dependent dehydrogenase (short-subunit alcohol dehydrogenase family)
MLGKVCVVTGATSGIGEVTARRLAEDGATVVIVGRSRDKAEATVGRIERATGVRVDTVLADFASLIDVRRAATDLLSRCPRIDVLVNNAGAIHVTRSTTKDSIETTFGVNHLAPFLLTLLLLDRIKASAPARIVSVASRAHIRSALDLADLESKNGSYSGFLVYSRSKLCNVLFTYELARRLEGTGVTTNCLHPGVIASGFGKNEPGIFNWGAKLVAPLLTTPEKGARTSLFLAESPSVEGVTGKYFDSDTKEIRSSKASYDRDVQRRLWEISEKMTGISA